MKAPSENGTVDAAEAERSVAASSSAASDAPPSNRASDSCIEFGCRLLSNHIDSLELSYQGLLHSAVGRELANLKSHAQSQDDAFQALAQLIRGDDVFAVHDRGHRRFPYVISNDMFWIKLASSSAGRLPMASCQVRNAALMAFGVVECERRLRCFLQFLGELSGEAVVSRIDAAVDFTACGDLEAWDQRAWVTRIRRKNKYAVGESFSGWAIGSHADPVSFGLYDKTREIQDVSSKRYMYDVWQKAGWFPGDPVWRAEARFRREYLRGLGLNSVPEALNALPALWLRFLNEVVCLKVPNESDETRSRWPDHPLWTFFRIVEWGAPPERLIRMPRKSQAPSDQYLGRQGVALLSSLMGRDGIGDPSLAMLALERVMRQYLLTRQRVTELIPEDALLLKARAKGTRYGTMRNGLDSAAGHASGDAASEHSYRDASRGK